MKYSIEFNSQDIDLPNYNLDIAEALEKADKANMSESKSYREKTEILYKTLSNVLGSEKVEELVGKLKECDPNDIQILFLTIGNEYNKPVDKFQEQQYEQTLHKLDGVTDLADKLSKVPDTVERLK